METTTDVDALKQQIRALENVPEPVGAVLDALVAALEAALARIAELEATGKTSPPWAKGKTPRAASEDRKPRRQRALSQNGVRRRQTPPQVVEPHLEHCPDCSCPLSAARLAWVRQVEDIPPPPPVEVVEHRVYKGWCSRCRKWRSAPLELVGQVIG